MSLAGVAYPSQADIYQIQRLLLSWGQDHFQDYPWRHTTDPYAGLIAEILLQRTRADSVTPVYEKFLRRFPTPELLAEATEEHIEEVIYPLGLRWRVPLIAALGKDLTALGEIPREEKTLRALPGIGPYTAAAWLSFHADSRGVLIDSNVVRWICRLIGKNDCNGETRRKKWLRNLAELLTPDKDVRAFNYALLDFTMTICIPGKPHCEACPIGPAYCTTGRIRLAGQDLPDAARP